MITNNKKIVKLEEYEYCYNTEHIVPCPSGGTMKMYIPKLMRDIGFGEPDTDTEDFGGDSILSNDKKCKPIVKKSIPIQNWLDVELWHNNDTWEHIIDGEGKVPKKTQFIANFINGEISRRYFTTNI